jgi:hypothetical protein
MLGTGWIVFWVCIGVFSAFGWVWVGYKMYHQFETPSEPTEEINNFLSWGSTANNDYSLI